MAPSGKLCILNVICNATYSPIIRLNVCSGYELQFHVVTDKMEKDLAGVPVIPAPLLEPEGPLATLSKAQSSSKPLSFRIPYAPFELPKKITVSENRLDNTLKSQVSYSVVTVAYSSARRIKLVRQRELTRTM